MILICFVGQKHDSKWMSMLADMSQLCLEVVLNTTLA